MEVVVEFVPRRYAFVVPRFGRGMGGAENLTAELASRLKDRGDNVEILTTCARDNRTWANEYAPGRTDENGLSVTRFTVDPRNLESWIPKQIAISEGRSLSLDDQLAWMAEGVNSSGLYRHILEHASKFDAIFFAPYLFPTTFWGSLICPAKSYLIPCLHDEAAAYTDVVQSMFRQVRGALFNAGPERDLAAWLYEDVPGGEVGMGFVAPSPEEVKGLSPFFEEDFQYLLYLGRKETGKNAQLLIDYFCGFKESSPDAGDLRLVIAGGGSFED
ncbi:MAG: glycosyltransferase, partial [Deltaproteobacteria bacterium]|nr:glycosyltransferase [Deltaproteobacteria bacterium]